MGIATSRELEITLQQARSKAENEGHEVYDLLFQGEKVSLSPRWMLLVLTDVVHEVSCRCVRRAP
jgi:hypothetical protein